MLRIKFDSECFIDDVEGSITLPPLKMIVSSSVTMQNIMQLGEKQRHYSSLFTV